MNKIFRYLAILATTATALADTAGFAVFRSLAESEKGNLTFSPAGLENLLRSLRSYSSGETRKILNKISLSKPNTHSAMKVRQADAIFAAHNITLNPGFGDVHTVNFGKPVTAAASINSWCHKQTEGMIPTIVQPSDLDANTAFVSANAIYLHEKWLCPFNTETTRDAVFTCANGEKKMVPMMQEENKFHVMREEDWIAVALPYDTKGNNGTPGYFIGILPGSSMDARAFAANFTQEKYNAIRKALRANDPVKVRVCLPRFSVKTPVMELRPALEKLGLSPLFQQADFSRLVKTAPKPLYLSRVIQKCCVDVDEQGTRAAAVTAAVARFKGLPRSVYFNRPFIWIIGELQGNSAPWFMGLYEQP